MPVIAINIDQSLYTAVEQTLATGNYSDLQQFFVVAVRNQLALEESAGLAQPARPPFRSAAAGSPSSAPAGVPSVSAAGGPPAMLTAVPAPAAAALPEPIR